MNQEQIKDLNYQKHKEQKQETEKSSNVVKTL